MKSYKRHVVGKVTFTVSKEIVFIEKESIYYVDVCSTSDEGDGYEISWKDFAPHLTEQYRNDVRNTSIEVVEDVIDELVDFESPYMASVERRKEQVE